MTNVLSRLHEIAAAVIHAAEATKLEVVLERIADVSRELAETKYAALGIPDGEDGLRYFKTSGITPEHRQMMGHLPRGHGLIGAIMREQRVIRLENIQDDPRSSGFSQNHPTMTSFLGVPVAIGNALYGMLYLCDKIDGTPFNDEDQVLIETLAGYAALAIAGAELRENLSRIRLLEERERIGMELHDSIIQSLYGIGMQVDLLRKSPEESFSVSALDMVVDSLNEVIEDIRTFIANLRHANSLGLTVRQCLINLKDRLHPPQALQFEIDAPDTPIPLPAPIFESMCLIINEGLSNAIRHANASIIKLQAEVRDREFHLMIIDDGDGFDIAIVNNHKGLGLNNMRHRAQLLGIQIRIESELGEGTIISIVAPIRRI